MNDCVADLAVDLNSLQGGCRSIFIVACVYNELSLLTLDPVRRNHGGMPELIPEVFLLPSPGLLSCPDKTGRRIFPLTLDSLPLAP